MKNTTNYTTPTKNTTDNKSSTAFDNAVKMGSLTVKLSSLVVNMRGNISGHFNDNKVDTAFSNITKQQTEWSNV